MAYEARSHPRSRADFPAAAEGPRGPVRGTCTNLSLGGLFIAGAQLAVGSMTTVTVQHPSMGRFTAQAEVRHHTGSPKGMGLQFTRLDPDQVELLKRILASLEGI